MLIYLDICCFNRPYDDQSFPIIQLESEAKLFIQSGILNNTFDLVWSYIMDYENSVNPYTERTKTIAKWKNLAKVDIDVSANIVDSAKTIMTKGIKKKDALHLACALAAKSEYFLTTDKKLLNTQLDNITIMNPLDFIRKIGDGL